MTPACRGKAAHVEALPRALDIRIAGVADAPDWNEFVAAVPGGGIYHRFDWATLIETVHRMDCPYLIARREGRCVGVLPLVQLRSALFGNFMVSLPYLTAGGALGESPSIVAALMTEAAELASERGCSHFECRDSVPAPVAWPVRTDKVLMQLELPGTEGELSKLIGKKLRAQVKRPVREGATVHWGGLDLLDEFYHVFAHNMRDLGTPVYARAFFAGILERFGEETRLCVVRIGARPVAAAFLIDDGDRTDIPWASSLREFGRISVNMMLYFEVLRDCVERGQAVFDFGRSTQGSGTWRFKRQWGAEPRPCYWHYWQAEPGELPGLRPDNPKFALAIAAWQKMPVWATRILGPHLVKHLP